MLSFHKPLKTLTHLEQFSVELLRWKIDSSTLMKVEMDVPQSEDDAQAHIAEIRAAKSLENAQSDVSDLENALVM